MANVYDRFIREIFALMKRHYSTLGNKDEIHKLYLDTIAFNNRYFPLSNGNDWNFHIKKFEGAKEGKIGVCIGNNEKRKISYESRTEKWYLLDFENVLSKVISVDEEKVEKLYLKDVEELENMAVSFFETFIGEQYNEQIREALSSIRDILQQGSNKWVAYAWAEIKKLDFDAEIKGFDKNGLVTEFILFPRLIAISKMLGHNFDKELKRDVLIDGLKNKKEIKDRDELGWGF